MAEKIHCNRCNVYYEPDPDETIQENGLTEDMEEDGWWVDMWGNKYCPNEQDHARRLLREFANV